MNNHLQHSRIRRRKSPVPSNLRKGVARFLRKPTSKIELPWVICLGYSERGGGWLARQI